MRCVLNLLFLVSYLSLGVLAYTKYVKVLPSDAKVKPRHNRIQIPTIFAKKYWISGTFFNKENFQGLPMSFYFTGSKCINFPHLKTLSSLKPIGCVMLYKAKECQGPYALVSDDMADLNTIGMHDAVGSMKSCPPVDDSWKPKGQKNQKGQQIHQNSEQNHQNDQQQQIQENSQNGQVEPEIDTAQTKSQPQTVTLQAPAVRVETINSTNTANASNSNVSSTTTYINSEPVIIK